MKKFSVNSLPKMKRKFVNVPDKNSDKESKSNLPIVYGEGKKTPKLRFNLKEQKTLKSIFGERTEDMLTMIENNNRDGAVVLIYKQLLKSLVVMIPVLENVVQKSKGRFGTYQVNQLMSQTRELLADMQAVQDRGLLGRTLVQRYVRPAFLDIAMQMVENDHRVLNDVLQYVHPKYKDKIRTQILGSQRELAKYIQTQYQNISENIIRGLT